MRVIAGTYRSRPLDRPPGLATRPTSDRLRETLFNVLAARIEGAFFADLYAGSGAVGIEALSRGASQVWFVERRPPRWRRSAPILPRSRLNPASTSRAAASRPRWPLWPGARSKPWDIIFLDPPYEAGRAYASTLTTSGRASGRTAGPGWHRHRRASQRQPRRAKTTVPATKSTVALHRTRMLEQGDAALSFYSSEPVSRASNRRRGVRRS